MVKVKLTKSDLKIQKDALKRFERFLPMLQLKKQQLQIEARRIRHDLAKHILRRNHHLEEIDQWSAVLGSSEDVDELIKVKDVSVRYDNVAGVRIPRLREILFAPVRYDLFSQPLWMDKAVPAIQKLAEFDFEIQILDHQRKLVSRELKVTSQRVNLFERIRIPETARNIRKLKTFLGDQDTAAVVRGKMSKRKRIAASDSNR